MNEKKLVHNFKSYLGLENPALKSIIEKNGPLQELKPKLLTGELVVGAAHNVVMFTPLSDRDQGKTGSLFVTNYKLSFITPDQSQNEKEAFQQNMLLGTHDVSLSNVGAVWLTDASNPMRRRRLIPFGPMPNKVKGLQIICKNMKVMSFSFKYSPVGQGRTIAVSLIHHAFPKRHSLLFAYDYREPYYPTMPPDMNTFTRPGDWKRELERCDCAHWRMACINGPIDSFMSGASETLIVPNSALDYNLIESARHFRSGRVPIWVWGVSAGAALLRSGELLPTEQSATAESVLLEQVRRSHPKLTAPRVLYLCGNSLAPSANNAWLLPPLQALQMSYKKLVEICTPPNLRHYWEQDSQFYSSLDNSRWLKYVSSCLIFAETAAQLLRENTTVVLQEGDGVDYSAIVSCLTQILLDPQTRTISGFQSLIQKEWVALGHPFCDRLGHLSSSNTKEEKLQLDCMKQPAPVFLLFLDCCWQLLRQFPTAFQFTDTYLVTLWDCSHNQIFDTFIFNCPRDRELAVSKNLILRPVWDWGEQFSEQDMDMFYNPIYVPHIPPAKSPRPMSNVMNNLCPAQTSTSSMGHLYPSTAMSSLDLWSQCYQRWLSPLDLPGGGDVQYYVHNVAIMRKINLLREELASLPVAALSPHHRYSNGRPEATPPTPEPLPRPLVSTFYPFTASRGGKPSDGLASLHVSLLDPADLLDSQSLLNAPD